MDLAGSDYARCDLASCLDSSEQGDCGYWLQSFGPNPAAAVLVDADDVDFSVVARLE